MLHPAQPVRTLMRLTAKASGLTLPMSCLQMDRMNWWGAQKMRMSASATCRGAREGQTRAATLADVRTRLSASWRQVALIDGVGGVRSRHTNGPNMLCRQDKTRRPATNRLSFQQALHCLSLPTHSLTHYAI